MAAQVTLHEAAAYLGVSKTTLRNWDQEGKLTAIKNPADGTRLYDMTELLAVKQAMGGVHANISSSILRMQKKCPPLFSCPEAVLTQSVTAFVPSNAA